MIWVVYARENLRPKQLELAAGMRSEPKTLSIYNVTHAEHLVLFCCGSVTEDKGSGTVRPAHYTAQQYFETSRPKWFYNPHALVARSCLTYLALASSGNLNFSIESDIDGSGEDESTTMCVKSCHKMPESPGLGHTI